VKRIVEELRARGELPAPLKGQFVRDLLERATCICGSSLAHGTDSYDMVSAWLERSSEEGVEQRTNIMGAKLKELDAEIDEFWNGLDDKQVSIQSTKDALWKIENELGDLKEKLRNSPSEDIQNLSKRVEDCEDLIRTRTIEKGRNEQKLHDLERKIKDVNDDIRKLEEKQGKQSQARRRCDAADEAVVVLEELTKLLGEQFRLQLEQKLQKIFSKMVVYPHVPKIDPNYELAVFESTTGKELPVPKSTGQSQVLCLAFIVSIIDCVREWKSKNAVMGLDSTTFPMVIDSAFSNLDEINGRQVARCIPDLVNQLVLFVNKTQWRQEVAEEITPRVGRKYVLCYETPKEGKPSDSLVLDGQKYDLVKRSRDNFDYTEILEI
jgi:DNA sulfur modification protein DndD